MPKIFMGQTTPRGLHRQRGAFSIITAFTLVTLLLCLGLVVDSGLLYLKQRHLQKVADMAALETVLRLDDGSCASDIESARRFARQSAARNDFNLDVFPPPTVTCVSIGNANGIRYGVADTTGDALTVTVSQTAPASVIMQVRKMINDSASDTVALSATSTAYREPPVAAFTVGSQLMRLDNNALLGRLLAGIGLNPDVLTALDSAGLTSITVTPAGLLQALGIDLGIEQLRALSPRELIGSESVNLNLAEIIQLYLDVLPRDSTLSLAAQLHDLQLNVAGSALKAADIKLFGLEDDSALIKFSADTDAPLGAALDVGIQLSDLLTASLYAAYQGQGLKIPELNLLGAAQVRLGIVEPPAIGIGPIHSSAYNAQIRLYIEINTENLLGGLGELIGALTGLKVYLPVWVDLVASRGELQDIHCGLADPAVDIALESELLNLCIGDLPDDSKWSSRNSCAAHLQEAEFISVAPLGLPVLTVAGKAQADVLPHAETMTDMSPGESQSPTPTVNLTGTVSSLLSNLPLLADDTGSLSLLTPVLTVVDSLLNSIVLSILDILGLQLGRTDVEVESISCGAPTIIL